MAIRKFEFTVKEDGITPAVEQRVGLQNEFKATQLVFNIEDGLYSKLLAAKGDNSLVYRFDCYNSAGGATRLDTNPLENAAVTYSVGEYLTRYGGKATVNLVISIYNSEDATELELISYPAKLRFESVPFISVEERESLSTLAEVAKNAAKRAAVAEAVATTAQGKTEQAQRALESGSEFFFDGGDSSGCAKAGLVVDSELSETSENPVENKAVTLKIKELRKLIYSAVSLAINEKNQKDYPLGKVLIFTDDTDPATLYGGTWERIKGRVIWGIDDGETAGATGGNKTHSHTLGNAFAEFYAHSSNGGGFSYAEVSSVKSWNATHNVAGNNASENVAAATYGTAIGGATDTESNMMPYYGAYVWRRIA